jgi:2-oxoglutarate ferredoxin oxidoreductase subunit beta
MLLTHPNGMQVSDTLSGLYTTQEEHDPSDLNRAREISMMQDKMPVGILYQNENVQRYDELKRPKKTPTVEQRRDTLNRAFDTFGIDPKSS